MKGITSAFVPLNLSGWGGLQLGPLFGGAGVRVAIVGMGVCVTATGGSVVGAVGVGICALGVDRLCFRGLCSESGTK